MRIRTDGEYAHREDTIEAAADRLDCNKTRAVLVSCEVVGDVLDDMERALEHPDLPPNVKQDIADTLSNRSINVEVEDPEASVSIN